MLAKFGEWYPREAESALAYQLRLPSLPLQVAEWCRKGAKATQRSPLLRCPLELVLSILDYLKYWDVVCLSITCKDLLELSKTTLLTRLRKKYAPWAHSRLACLLYSHPPGLLTAEEVAEYMHADLSDLYDGHWEPEFGSWALEVYEHCDCLPPYNYREQKYRNAVIDAILEDGKNGMQSVTQARLDQEMLCALWPYRDHEVSYAPGVPVLCNESKGLYIRQDTLNVGVKYPATLSHALAVKIMWCPGETWLYVGCSEAYAERIVQGDWAGDRFCMVTLDTMPKLGGGREWQDATDDVRPVLQHLWDMNEFEDFGSRDDFY
ncbi:hypothetical protein C8Q70DRAFT_178944 [Cubamyces menziesii]|nr:hypothetical protein C8Q70DRAFT_178944 [Cubamyces menziesii]